MKIFSTPETYATWKGIFYVMCYFKRKSGNNNNNYKKQTVWNTIDIKYLTIRRGAHIQIYQYLTRNEQIQSFFILCCVIWRRKNHSFCIDWFPSEKWERREASRNFVLCVLLISSRLLLLGLWFFVNQTAQNFRNKQIAELGKHDEFVWMMNQTGFSRNVSGFQSPSALNV